MNRDMDLIRTILLKIEADPKYNGSYNSTDAASLGIDDHTGNEVAYHLAMLVDAGFLDGNTKMVRHGVVMVARLTWHGHEFLDDIRDPDVWRKTKERTKLVAGVGLNFVWEIAKVEIKTKLGLP